MSEAGQPNVLLVKKFGVGGVIAMFGGTYEHPYEVTIKIEQHEKDGNLKDYFIVECNQVISGHGLVEGYTEETLEAAKERYDYLVQEYGMRDNIMAKLSSVRIFEETPHTPESITFKDDDEVGAFAKEKADTYMTPANYSTITTKEGLKYKRGGKVNGSGITYTLEKKEFLNNLKHLDELLDNTGNPYASQEMSKLTKKGKERLEKESAGILRDIKEGRDVSATISGYGYIYTPEHVMVKDWFFREKGVDLEKLAKEAEDKEVETFLEEIPQAEQTPVKPKYNEEESKAVNIFVLMDEPKSEESKLLQLKKEYAFDVIRDYYHGFTESSVKRAMIQTKERDYGYDKREGKGNEKIREGIMIKAEPYENYFQLGVYGIAGGMDTEITDSGNITELDDDTILFHLSKTYENLPKTVDELRDDFAILDLLVAFPPKAIITEDTKSLWVYPTAKELLETGYKMFGFGTVSGSGGGDKMDPISFDTALSLYNSGQVAKAVEAKTKLIKERNKEWKDELAVSVNGNMESSATALTLEGKIAKAKELGKKAFHDGKKNIPAYDDKLVELLTGIDFFEVGTPKEKIIAAWNNAWHKENIARPLPSTKPQLATVERLMASGGTLTDDADAAIRIEILQAQSEIAEMQNKIHAESTTHEEWQDAVHIQKALRNKINGLNRRLEHRHKAEPIGEVFVLPPGKALIRINSHRARHKLDSIGIERKEKFNFGQGHFDLINASDLDKAISVTGVHKVIRMPSELLDAWAKGGGIGWKAPRLKQGQALPTGAVFGLPNGEKLTIGQKFFVVGDRRLPDPHPELTDDERLLLELWVEYDWPSQFHGEKAESTMHSLITFINNWKGKLLGSAKQVEENENLLGKDYWLKYAEGGGVGEKKEVEIFLPKRESYEYSHYSKNKEPKYKVGQTVFMSYNGPALSGVIDSIESKQDKEYGYQHIYYFRKFKWLGAERRIDINGFYEDALYPSLEEMREKVRHYTTYLNDEEAYATGGAVGEKPANLKISDALYQDFFNSTIKVIDIVGIERIKAEYEQQPERTVWNIFGEIRRQKEHKDDALLRIPPAISNSSTPQARVIEYDETFRNNREIDLLSDHRLVEVFKTIVNKIIENTTTLNDEVAYATGGWIGNENKWRYSKGKTKVSGLGDDAFMTGDEFRVIRHPNPYTFFRLNFGRGEGIQGEYRKIPIGDIIVFDTEANGDRTWFYYKGERGYILYGALSDMIKKEVIEPVVKYDREGNIEKEYATGGTVEPLIPITKEEFEKLPLQEQVHDFFLVKNIDGNSHSFDTFAEGGLPFYVTTREGVAVYKAISREDALAWINDRYVDEKGLTATEKRVLQNYHLHGYPGKMGSLNQGQRLKVLEGLIAKGFLDKNANITQKGIEASTPFGT